MRARVVVGKDGRMFLETALLQAQVYGTSNGVNERCERWKEHRVAETGTNQRASGALDTGWPLLS